MALKNVRRRGSVAAAILAASALGLAACNDDTAGPETGTDVEDIQEEDDEVLEPYDGPYDTAFDDDMDSYVGEEVTVSADINEVITPSSFVIAGTEDTDVDPLLVVSADEVSGLEPGDTVVVTGIVRETFDLTAVEGDLEMDLDDDLYDAWDTEPYIEATNVETVRAEE